MAVNAKNWQEMKKPNALQTRPGGGGGGRPERGLVAPRDPEPRREGQKPSALGGKPAGGGDARRKATFVAEPLERGFGLTLGNSLRRVLLSSLAGAAGASVTDASTE